MCYKFSTVSLYSHSSTEEIRLSFIHSLSPDDKLPDEVLFPTTEHPNTHEDEASLACHPISSCLKISEEIDNNTLGTQKEKEVTESWDISRNEIEDNVGSDSLAKWKLVVSIPAEEATRGGEDGGMLNQQRESHLLSGSVTTQESSCDAHSPKLTNLFGEEGVELIVDSESLTEAITGQMSNKEHEMQDGLNGVKWKERGNKEATVLNGKGSANEMRGIRLLGSNRNTSLERNLNLLPTSIMEKIFDCDTEGEKLVEKEENDFVYRVNTPEIKEDEYQPGRIDVEISMECHAGSPTKSSLSSKGGDHKESHCHAENTEDMEHHAENPLMQPETKTADNLERTRKQRINAVEVRLEETEGSPKAGIDTYMEDKMDPEPHLCSNFQLTEKQWETDHKEICESPVRDTELRESGRDGDESVMPPVDSNECTSTGKYGLICKNTLFYLIVFFLGDHLKLGHVVFVLISRQQIYLQFMCGISFSFENNTKNI